jgi:putative ABC transport system permease protein
MTHRRRREATSRRPAASRLRAVDLLPLGLLALRARRVRTLLSALGVAIGIGAIVGVLGITRSSESALLAQIDQLGTNHLTIINGNSSEGQQLPLPATATAMIARMAGVQRESSTRDLPDVHVYRTDKVSAYQTGAIAVQAAAPALLDAVSGNLDAGVFLNAASDRFPVVVLGADAARTLGVRPPAVVWLGGRWFSVAGVLAPLPLEPELNRSALIGFPVAERLFGLDGLPGRIYVRADTSQVRQVAALLAPTVDPQSPQDVAVSQPSDALAARIAVAESSTGLYLGLGGVALLVGGIGIANLMVIAVLERRSEIGLRRSLGATRTHIGTQFLTESLLLSTLGGLAGVTLGMAASAALALARHWQLLVPGVAVWGGLGVALALGGIAGVYPAAKAAGLSPTEALRST